MRDACGLLFLFPRVSHILQILKIMLLSIMFWHMIEVGAKSVSCIVVISEIQKIPAKTLYITYRNTTFLYVCKKKKRALADFYGMSLALSLQVTEEGGFESVITCDQGMFNHVIRVSRHALNCSSVRLMHVC